MSADNLIRLCLPLFAQSSPGRFVLEEDESWQSHLSQLKMLTQVAGFGSGRGHMTPTYLRPINQFFDLLQVQSLTLC